MAGPLDHLRGILPPEVITQLEIALVNPQAAVGLPSLGPLAGLLPRELVVSLEEAAVATTNTTAPSLAPLSGLLPQELVRALQGIANNPIANLGFNFDFTSGVLPGGLTVTRTGGTVYPQRGTGSLVAVTTPAIFEDVGGGWGYGMWLLPAKANRLSSAASRDFSAAAGWTVANAVVTPNAATGPDGATLASKLQVNAGATGVVHQDALGTATLIGMVSVWVTDVPADPPTQGGAISGRNDTGGPPMLFGTGLTWRRAWSRFAIGVNVGGYIYIYPVGAALNAGGDALVFDTSKHGSIYAWGAESYIGDSISSMMTPFVDGSSSAALCTVNTDHLNKLIDSNGDIHMEGAFLMDPTNTSAPATSYDDPSNYWLWQMQTPNGVWEMQWYGQTIINARVNGLDIIGGTTLTANIGFQTYGQVGPAEFKWEIWNKPTLPQVGMQFWYNGFRDSSTVVRTAIGVTANAQPTSFNLSSKTDGTGILARRHTLLRAVTDDLNRGEAVMLGDSLTSAYSPYTAAGAWIYTLAESRARSGIISYSFPGNKVEDQQAKWDAGTQKGRAAIKWVFILCGINNLAGAAEPAATVAGRLNTLIADINAANPTAKVIVCPMLPALNGVGATVWAQALELNNDIAGTGPNPIVGSNLLIMPYVKELDAGWIASGVVNGILDLSFDSGDGLHGNDAARHQLGSGNIRSFLQAHTLL